jgi:site-specific recombinase XerD
MLFWHGMRASELSELRMADTDLNAARVFFSRCTGSRNAHHPMRGDVLRAIRAYLRSRKSTKLPWVFVNERGQPFARRTIYRVVSLATELCGMGKRIIRSRFSHPFLSCVKFNYLIPITLDAERKIQMKKFLFEYRFRLIAALLFVFLVWFIKYSL